MTRTVFWDTAAFVALGNRDDQLHDAAIAVSKSLVQARVSILTTDAVLLEVANAFSKSALRSLARRVVESTFQSASQGNATVVHVDEILWQRGWRLFLDRADKDWGLTDCLSFVVMADLQLTEAFTSDKHFEQAGFVRLMKMQ